MMSFSFASRRHDLASGDEAEEPVQLGAARALSTLAARLPGTTTARP